MVLYIGDGKEENDKQGWNNFDTAMEWAKRRSFKERHLKDFEGLARLLQKTRIASNRLKIQGYLDKGAFGSIDKAMLDARQVAVKKVSKDVAGQKPMSQLIRELSMEIKVVSNMGKHPHICEFIGTVAYFPSEQDHNQDFSLGLVYEMCDLKSIAHQVYHMKRSFSFSEKVRMCCEIASGMAYMHNRGVIHRDLNTRNVLLTAGLRAKVCDFGFARCSGGRAYDSTTISGTAEYMPPEQLTGQPLTVQVDVWAMGCTMWELVMLVPPWQQVSKGVMVGDNHDAIVNLVCKQGQRLATPPTSRVPDNPPGARDEFLCAMNSCFRTFAQNRPTMDQLHASLKDLHSRYLIPADCDCAASCFIKNCVPTTIFAPPAVMPRTQLRTMELPPHLAGEFGRHLRDHLMHQRMPFTQSALTTQINNDNAEQRNGSRRSSEVSRATTRDGAFGAYHAGGDLVSGHIGFGTPRTESRKDGKATWGEVALSVAPPGMQFNAAGGGGGGGRPPPRPGGTPVGSARKRGGTPPDEGFGRLTRGVGSHMMSHNYAPAATPLSSTDPFLSLQPSFASILPSANSSHSPLQTSRGPPPPPLFNVASPRIREATPRNGGYSHMYIA